MRNILITAILLLLLVPSRGTRYMHDTGVIQLRVDDVYPGGFVELNYLAHDSVDIMWLSFLGIMFENWEVPFYGRAADEGTLYYANMDPTEYLVLEEDLEIELIDSLVFEYDTIVVDSLDTVIVDSVAVDTIEIVDTTVIGADSYLAFGQPGYGFYVYQEVSSVIGEPYIHVRWIIKNLHYEYSDLLGGEMVFHFDADVYGSQWNDDVAIAIDGHIAACQLASQSDSTCTGIIWLRGGTEQTLENTRGWFDFAESINSVIDLIRGRFWFGSEYCDTAEGDTVCPVFVDGITGDCGIGVLISLPDIVYGEAETLEFVFVVAPNPDSFTCIAENLDTVGIAEMVLSNIPSRIKILATPNPFNSACRICLPGANAIAVLDLAGRTVETLSVEDGVAIWRPDGIVPAGIYLLMAETPKGSVSGKILYLK